MCGQLNTRNLKKKCIFNCTRKMLFFLKCRLIINKKLNNYFQYVMNNLSHSRSSTLNVIRVQKCDIQTQQRIKSSEMKSVTFKMFEALNIIF